MNFYVGVGKEYYRFQGQELNRPKDKLALPAQQFL